MWFTYKRTVIVLWHIVPIILSFVRDFKRFIFWGTGRTLSDAQHQQRATHLTHTLEYLGPTFIKLAQALSARADVLPPTYIVELSTLQDKVRPNPTDEIVRVIEEDWQRPLDAVLEDFDREPLAAASLGQVHRARYQGDDVVVKVLRPGVHRVVLTDLKIIHGILSILNVFISYSPFLRSLTTVISEFQRVIQEEMDFQLETRHAERFHKNLAHVEHVLLPRVYQELTTRRVIVLEFLEGVKINQVRTLEQMGIDIDEIIRRLARIYIHQVMVDGFLHADPHPGNILITAQSQIIILDFGMTIEIDDHFKRHIIKYAIAIAHRDIDGMINELYELGIVERGTNKAMLRDLSVIMIELQEEGKISAHKVQDMSNAMMELFYEFPFTLPSELVYITRAATLLEGIGFIHDPWFDALSLGTPIVKEIAKEKLKGELGGNLLETLQAWAAQSYSTLSALQDIILKTDREQLRLHWHPATMQSLNAMIGRATRHIAAGMLALLIGLVSTALYLRDGNSTALMLGTSMAAAILLVLLLLPSKLPRVKAHRYVQKQIGMMTTESGELYKSLLMNQMSAEEREKMEEEREEKR